MWTITGEQIENIESKSGKEAIMPCEQVEVASISVGEPIKPPAREVISSRWLTEDNVEIKSSLTQRDVKIEMATRGIPDNDVLNVKIIDKKDNLIKELKIKVSGNKAISDVFNIKEDWLNLVLKIKIDKI